MARVNDLALLVVDCEKGGTIEGWRAYIMDQAKKANITNAELKAAIEKARAAQSCIMEKP